MGFPIKKNNNPKEKNFEFSWYSVKLKNSIDRLITVLFGTVLFGTQSSIKVKRLTSTTYSAYTVQRNGRVLHRQTSAQTK